MTNRPKTSDFPEIDQQTLARHQIVTLFCIGAHRGILITVQNSPPFTAEQKFTLSLLREHLAIAARRHYRRDPIPMFTNHRPEHSDLSRREMAILPFLAKGLANPDIANALGFSILTVEKHVASILEKSVIDDRRLLIGPNSLTKSEMAVATG